MTSYLDKETDNVYLNVSVYNETKNTTGLARYSENFDSSILDKASDYYLSVTKFSIPLQALPLFVFPTPGTGNDFQIGVKDKNFSVPPANPPETVQFISQNTFTDIDDFNYYYVYSYSHFCEMINVALRASWVANGSPGGGGAEPYITYSAKTQLFSWIIPAAFFNAGAGWTVFWNNNLNIVIPSFDINLIDRGGANVSTYELKTSKLLYDNTFKLPFGMTSAFTLPTFQIEQEYPMFDYLNGVRRIIITTRNIPSRAEFYPPPRISNEISKSGLNSTIPILADFQLDLNTRAGTQREVAVYDADLYKLIDLSSDAPLRKIDLSFFWADANNNLYPIFITKNDSIYVKIGFFNKKLYRSTSKY